MKMFNTAGPCIAEDHYLIDPLVRLDLPEVEAMIAAKRYFVLHAPRQTGKTTSLLALMDHLNAQEKYRALYVNVEIAQTARQDVVRGMRAICGAVVQAAALYLQDVRLKAWMEPLWESAGPDGVLTALLAQWCAASERPIVLILDEVDALVGDTLISLLRQIRAGYTQRPKAFPQSVILCGVRDVRDYRIHTANQEIITGGSAFNIKAESLRLGSFSRDEMQALWQQHQDASGQAIDPAIYPELWLDTQGQPWLVNALGYELIWKNRRLRDPSQPITLADYKMARESLIQSRATHLDQLTDKLREERVRRVVAPLLSGEGSTDDVPADDQHYVEDLGLIRTHPQLTIANRIYQEVIPRELTWVRQTRIAHDQQWYLTPHRRLDMAKLLTAFQQFFRENADAWIQQFDYKEAGPQLLLQAFLQRIVNGGGRISREYGLGLRRTDLYLEWPVDEAQGYTGPVQRVVLELKLLRYSLEKTLADGLTQTADYADRCGADEAHLLIFDRRGELSWDERIWQRQETQDQQVVSVWGM
jgi:hypothetical protein